MWQSVQFLAATILLLGNLLGSESGQVAGVPKSQTELIDAIRNVLEETNTPGAGLAIVNRDTILLSQGLGVANRHSQQPVTTETMFRAGSISKSLTALALLKLQEAGQVSLEDRLSEIVPEVQFANRWEHTTPLKLVHVLEHTSGFDEVSLGHFTVSVPASKLRDSLQFDPRPRISRWCPGTFFSYSNANYEVAGYVVEKASGRDFDEYLTSELLEPLEMPEASFLLTDYVQDHLATGYGMNGVSPRPYEHILGRSSGAFNCTPTQLGHLVQMLLNRGIYAGRQLLTKESIERMETPTTCITAQHGMKDGYGLGNFTYSHAGHRLHGHAGAVDGFLASYAYSPEHGVGYAIMINGFSGEALNRIEKMVLNYLSRDWPKAQIEAPSMPPHKRLSRIEGYYEPKTLRHEQSRFLYRLLGLQQITASQQGLEIGGLLSKPVLYVPTELEGGFRRVSDPGATLLFLDEAGEMVMASAEDRGHENLRRMAGWQFWGQALVIGYCAVSLLSSLLVAAVWVPQWILRHKYHWRELALRVLPFATVISLLCFAGLVLLSLEDPILLLARPTVVSVGISALTWVFAVLTIASWMMVLQSRRWPTATWIWWHALTISISTGIILVYLCYWGIIGVRTWA